MTRLLAAKRPIMMFAMFLVAAMAVPAMAQQQPAPGGGGGAGGPGGFGGGRIDPTQFRQMMNDRMKELMGANDEEWKALQPRIEKVQQLSRDASNFGGMGLLMDFGQGGGGGRGAGSAGRAGRAATASRRRPSRRTPSCRGREEQDVVPRAAQGEARRRQGGPGAGQGRAGQGPGGAA